MPLTATALPAESVWALPVADTRSPLSTVLIRSNADGVGIDAALGADFPILELRFSSGVDVQVGLGAGAFMAFGAGGELTFDLQTFDGRFGLPIDVRGGRWAVRAEWIHLSAHYGDGIRKSGSTPSNLGSYSREFIEVLTSRDLDVPNVLDARAYVGGHAVIHALPEALPFALQAGGEIFGPWSLAPYVAVDVQMAEEFAWTPAVTGQIGARYSRGRSRFRLAVAGRSGPDETGKTAGTPEHWLGLMFGFDRTGGIDE